MFIRILPHHILVFLCQKNKENRSERNRYKRMEDLIYRITKLMILNFTAHNFVSLLICTATLPSEISQSRYSFTMHTLPRSCQCPPQASPFRSRLLIPHLQNLAAPKVKPFVIAGMAKINLRCTVLIFFKK